MTEQTARFRLVLCRKSDRRGQYRPVALLYPVDAGRWTQPAWSFRLSPSDPILPVPAREVVVLDPAPRDGLHVRVTSGSHELLTSHPLRRGVPELGARMFAQQGDEILHPALGGRAMGIGDDATKVRRQVRTQVLTGIVSLLLGAGLLWLGVASERGGTPFGRLWGAVVGLFAGGVLVIGTAVRRGLELRAIGGATSEPGLPMVLRISWVIGTGFGVVALAQLRSPGAHPRHGVERALGVVNVPAALVELEPRDHDCVVHGDLARGVVAIDVDDTTLLPAPGPYRSIPPS